MINLPEIEKAFEYENNFYLSCRTQRLSKFIAHYELFKRVNDLTGEIVECGVFKGASFVRWCHFRSMLGESWARKIIGFDIFGKFPAPDHLDMDKLKEWTAQAGDESIGRDQLFEILDSKGMNSKIELISGDINSTIPKYVEDHPELRIALLNLDTDIYEPSVTILENLYDKIVPGGVLILDDYGVFHGETKAADEFFKDMKVKIQKFPFSMTPAFIIKD